MKMKKTKVALNSIERPTYDIQHTCPGCGKEPEDYRDSAGMPLLPGVDPMPDEDSVFCSGCAAQLGRENGWRIVAVIHKAKARPKKAEPEDAPVQS